MVYRHCYLNAQNSLAYPLALIIIIIMFYVHATVLCWQHSGGMRKMLLLPQSSKKDLRLFPDGRCHTVVVIIVIIMR